MKTKLLPDLSVHLYALQGFQGKFKIPNILPRMQESKMTSTLYSNIGTKGAKLSKGSVVKVSFVISKWILSATVALWEAMMEQKRPKCPESGYS